MELVESSDSAVDADADPREIYLNALFAPGVFKEKNNYFIGNLSHLFNPEIMEISWIKIFKF